MARSTTAAATLVKKLLNNSNGVTGEHVCVRATSSAGTVTVKTVDGDTLTLTVAVS